VAGAVAALAACTLGESNKAEEMFAQRFSCPDGRVTVKPHPGFNARDILEPGRKDKPTPPADVARDPGRLAVGQAKQNEVEERESSDFASKDVFEVTGCDHAQWYACYDPVNCTGCSWVSCKEASSSWRPPLP